MRVLLVYCHPVPESFCAAVCDSAWRGLTASGHEVELLDLYADGFDPVMGPEERRRYHEVDAIREPVQPHVDKLIWAEGLVFVYPTWWYGLPALLKGWLDRVFIPDVAFSLPQGGQPIRPKLQNIRKLAVVTTCGAPRIWSWFIGQPGRKTLLRGLRALCHRRCRTLYLAHYNMDSSTDRSRSAYLRKVEDSLARF